MNLAPISTPGSVEVTALSRQRTDGTIENIVQERLDVVMNSYVWEPWLVGVGADVTLAHENQWGDDSGSSFLGSADATISVLPVSDYPVTINLAHLDSRASGDFGASDYIRDRASISGRARYDAHLNGGFNASLERTDREDSGVLDSQNLSLNV